MLHVVLSLQLLDLDDALAFLGLQLNDLLVFLLPEAAELLAVRLQLLHQLHALLLHLLSRDRPPRDKSRDNTSNTTDTDC